MLALSFEGPVLHVGVSFSWRGTDTPVRAPVLSLTVQDKLRSSLYPRRRRLHTVYMQTRCSKCDAPMSCCPEGDCWCAAYPKTEPDPNATGCLCPECLREKLQTDKAPLPAKSKTAS